MQAMLGLPADPAVLSGALEGLCSANLALMQQAKALGKPAPPIYKSGVRYRREPPHEEKWDTWTHCLQRGYGDCEDLASWRVAELRFTGGDPYAQPWVIRTGPTTLHAVVRRGNGRIEDPSQRLGMPGGFDELGAVPAPEAQPIYRLQRVPGGYLLRVSVPGVVPVYMKVKDDPAKMAQAKTAAPEKKPAAVAAVKNETKAKGRNVAVRVASNLWDSVKSIAPAAAGIVADYYAPGTGKAAAGIVREVAA